MQTRVRCAQQVKSATESLPARRTRPALRETRFAGNQAALRRLTPAGPRIQFKLEIGAVNDPLEAEADRAADHVMRMPDPAGPIASAAPRISRKCASCEEEDKKLHTKADGAPAKGEAPPIVHEALQSPGSRLDAATRAFMEPRFGHDFSSVRIHSHARAAESAQSIGALAYAAGDSIAFAAGQYQPETASGRRLLAHELAHVVQQSAASSSRQGAALVQRYGQYPSCTTADHLVPYVWVGMPKAFTWVENAIAITSGPPATPAIGNLIRKFFGTDSLLPANLTLINQSFVKIKASLNSVMFHCSKRGGSVESGARACIGQDADTSAEGDRDVTLCFDPNTLPIWSNPNANAYTLIHEMGHRALQETYGHTWEGRFNNCLSGPPVGKFYNDNPSSYGCFAFEAFMTASAAAPAPAAPAPAPSAAPSPAPSGPVQRSATRNAGPSTAPANVQSTLNSAGQPLNAAAQSWFAPRFGHDFSGVRVHTDRLAAESAQAVHARAYAVGSHVVFNANEYSPDTPSGRKLLAHELAHVVQNDNAPAADSIRRDPKQVQEMDAKLKAALEAPTPDWNTAATVLNGYSPDDMLKRLGPLSAPQRASIHTAALAGVGPDSQVAELTDPSFQNTANAHFYTQDNFDNRFEGVVDPTSQTVTLLFRAKFEFSEGIQFGAAAQGAPGWQAETAAGKAKFKADFKSVVESTWSGKGTVHPKCALAGVSQLQTKVVVAVVESGAHTTFKVSKLGANQSAVKGNEGQLDVNDNAPHTSTSQVSDPTGKIPIQTSTTQIASTHEFGHAIGLPHVHCASGSDPCYGVTEEERRDVMGAGNVVQVVERNGSVKHDDFLPFERIATRWGNDVAGTHANCNVWSAI